MSRRQGYRAAWLVAVLAVCGCSQARLVQVNQDSGIVAIPTNSNSWPTYNHRAAEELMQRQFPEGYVIDQESRVVVGQHTTENVQGNNHSLASVVFGLSNETRTSESHDFYEWQIRFHRKGAAAPEIPPNGPEGVTAISQAVQGSQVTQAAYPLPREPIPAERQPR
jgi:hypothetical protein